VQLEDLLFGQVVVFVGGLAAHDEALLTGLSRLGFRPDGQFVQPEVGDSAAEDVFTFLIWGVLIFSDNHAH